jgi:hypothetical protein
MHVHVYLSGMVSAAVIDLNEQTALGPTPTTDPTTTTTQHTQTSGHICIQTRSKGHHQLVVGIKLNTSSLSSLRAL